MFRIEKLNKLLLDSFIRTSESKSCFLVLWFGSKNHNKKFVAWFLPLFFQTETRKLNQNGSNTCFLAFLKLVDLIFFSRGKSEQVGISSDTRNWKLRSDARFRPGSNFTETCSNPSHLLRRDGRGVATGNLGRSGRINLFQVQTCNISSQMGISSEIEL